MSEAWDGKPPAEFDHLEFHWILNPAVGPLPANWGKGWVMLGIARIVEPQELVDGGYSYVGPIGVPK